MYKSEKISKELLDSFSITSIYPSYSDYTVNLISKEINVYYNSKQFSGSVIGAIEIKKINIFYPILSEINKENLKISPCKFYGPNPNSIGNLCIAAHNYKNGTFFSNIDNLINGDIITIYDIFGNYIDYIVYDVYTVSSKDLSPIHQSTNNKKIITLVTCDSQDNNYRTIVKAKEL